MRTFLLYFFVCSSSYSPFLDSQKERKKIRQQSRKKSIWNEMVRSFHYNWITVLVAFELLELILTNKKIRTENYDGSNEIAFHYIWDMKYFGCPTFHRLRTKSSLYSKLCFEYLRLWHCTLWCYDVFYVIAKWNQNIKFLASHWWCTYNFHDEGHICIWRCRDATKPPFRFSFFFIPQIMSLIFNEIFALRLLLMCKYCRKTIFSHDLF